MVDCDKCPVQSECILSFNPSESWVKCPLKIILKRANCFIDVHGVE